MNLLNFNILCYSTIKFNIQLAYFFSFCSGFWVSSFLGELLPLLDKDLEYEDLDPEYELLLLLLLLLFRWLCEGDFDLLGVLGDFPLLEYLSEWLLRLL